MPIGDHIRDLRWDRRLKQGELAQRAGIAQNTLSQIELGKTTPSVPTLEKIARVLNLDLSELLVEEPVLASKAEAPGETGLADADPSSKLIHAEVLEDIAELWAAQLARGFYDRRTLGMMHMAGGILAMNHEGALGEDRENLSPNFLKQLEAAEERFVAVGTQIWEAIEEADHGHPTLPDELAARRKAKSEAREALRQQLRGGSPVEAEAN